MEWWGHCLHDGAQVLSACLRDGPLDCLDVSKYIGSDRPAASPSSHGWAHGTSSDHDTVALVVGAAANGQQDGGGLVHAIKS